MVEARRIKVKCGNERCNMQTTCEADFPCPLWKPVVVVQTKKKKRTTTQPIATTTETQEQVAVIEYCDYCKIAVIHIVNEGKRSVVNGGVLKRMGMRKGVPDLFFPKAMSGYHGMFIEMKRDTTCKPSKEQLAWIDYLNGQGYYAKVCYGASEAIKEINKYFEVR